MHKNPLGIGLFPGKFAKRAVGDMAPLTALAMYEIRIKILLCVIGKEVIEKGDLYGNGNHAAAFKSTPCVYSKRNR